MSLAAIQAATITPPSTLDEALDVIEKMRDASERIAKTADEQIKKLEKKISKLEEDNEGARAEISEIRLDFDDVSATVEHQADELARIRQKMVAGRVGEAIQDLDRVLLDVDPYCKARATAVAVML